MADSVIHVAGVDVQVGLQLRQRCAWCGIILLDYALDRVATLEGQDPRPATWPPGALVEVRGDASWRVPYIAGDQLPANACDHGAVVALPPADAEDYRERLATALQRVATAEAAAIRAQNRVTALEANGNELAARLDAAKAQLEWADFTATRGWWNWRIVQWWWWRQYRRADRKALRREQAELQALRAEAEDGITDELLDAVRAADCDVCGLPDPYNGQGDGIGSCDCPRCDGGEAAANSAFCTCPTEDDGPACWAETPGGGGRCGLDVDHEGDHRFNVWTPRPAADHDPPLQERIAEPGQPLPDIPESAYDANAAPLAAPTPTDPDRLHARVAELTALVAECTDQTEAPGGDE